MARIVFFMTFLGLFCIGMSQNHVVAATSPYSVKGVEVDVVDESSVKARNKAFIEAQRKAFEILATRYYAPDEIKTLKIPTDDTLSGLIQDFKIASEQISSKRYKGVFDFRFKAAAANQHFGRGPINFVAENDTSSKKILLIPYYLEEKKSIIFNKSQNPFWGSILQDLGSIKDIILPEGNIQDMTDIGNRNPSYLSPTIIRRLKARYDVGYIVTATAKVDLEDQSRIHIDIHDATTGKLVALSAMDVEPKLIGQATLKAAINVTKPQETIPVGQSPDEMISGNLTDDAVDQNTNSTSVVPQSEINPDYFLSAEKRRQLAMAQRDKMRENSALYGSSAESQSAQLNRLQKGAPGLRDGSLTNEEIEAGAAADAGEVNVQVYFNSMSEWVNLQKELSRLEGITGIRIVTLKTNQGDTVIEYNDWNKLLGSLKANRMILSPQSADTYILKRITQDF